MNVLAGVLRLWVRLLSAHGGVRVGVIVWCVGVCKNEVVSISCNGQAISAENIYNFLSV